MSQGRTNRKSVDKLNGFDSREAVWNVIREKQEFTVRELQQETTLEMSTVRDYVTGLAKAGYLEQIELPVEAKIERTKFKPHYFRLIRDVGIHAPRVRKDGSRVTQGQGRINMWRTMRILKVFSARELAVNSSMPECTVKLSTAEDYIHHLCRAGYMTQIADGKYRFWERKYTGPKPPMIQRVKRVWDPNLKKVMWSEDGGDG